MAKPLASPKLRPAPRVVRRYDSIGRPYYTRTSTGERVKKSSWERDLGRRDKEQSAAQFERARADAEEKDRRRQAKEERRRAKESGGGTKAPGRRGGKPTPPPEPIAPPPPFPPGVSFEGVPDAYVDDDGGVWDAYEVQGDDDTGGA